MTFRVAFCFCVVFLFKETLSWTIDLPEVRKMFFGNKGNFDDNRISGDKVIFDNIDSVSLHNKGYSSDAYHGNYADDFEYQSYMDQKVHKAVRDGSEYLEGLRKAIETFTDKLEMCRRFEVNLNQTVLRLFQNGTVRNSIANGTINIVNQSMMIVNNSLNMLNGTMTAMNMTDVMGDLMNFVNGVTNNTNNIVNLTMLNFSNMTKNIMNLTMVNMSNMTVGRFLNVTAAVRRTCSEANRASEHVRRLAQLALWAATELQEKAFVGKFDKDAKDLDQGLILRLAWFLDRLARLTGYDPNVKKFVDFKLNDTLVPSPPPMVFSLVPGVTEKDKKYLMNCLKERSNLPATERCVYPRGPNANATGNQASTVPPLEMMTSSSENHEQYQYSEQQEYSDENMPLTLPVKMKRSIQDPILNLIKYNAKENRQKRSLKKKNAHLLPHNLKGIKEKEVKHKTVDLKKFFDKLRNSKFQSKYLKNYNKKYKVGERQKRSVNGKKFLPRPTENPYQDISYYVKNKRGTNYKYDPVQAAQVRAGLEQVYQTGNIEVVRRFGSNYNPANTNHIIEGYIRGLADT